MNSNDIYVSLDIGTSSVKVIIGEMVHDTFNILGVGNVKSAGLRKGAIVDIDETVNSIKKAVEELFEVQVARVNTISCKGKTRTRNTKSGQVVGRTSDYKKAVVFLTEQSKPIAFFESLN
mgnify:CR=1 FL=1